MEPFFPEFTVVSFFICLPVPFVMLFVRSWLGLPLIQNGNGWGKPAHLRPKHLASKVRRKGLEYDRTHALPGPSKHSFMAVLVVYWLVLPPMCDNPVATWLMAGCACAFSLKLGDILYLRTVHELKHMNLADYVVEFVFFTFKEDVTFDKEWSVRLRDGWIDCCAMGRQILVVVTMLCWQQAVFKWAGGADRVDLNLWSGSSSVGLLRWVSLVFSALFIFYNVIHFYLRLAAAIASFFFGCRQHPGHYAMKAPWLATSPRDLWAQRWRHTLSHLYRATIFQPLVKRHQWDGGSAAMAVFVGSGLLHQYQNYVAFGDTWSAFLFFGLHGFSCLAQTALGPRLVARWPVWLCVVLCFLFNYFTAVQYFQPYFSKGFFDSFYHTMEPAFPHFYPALIHWIHDKKLCDINDADTGFVVVGGVLILGMMTALSFFTAGLLRSINTLSFLMQILTGIMGCSLLWGLIGYSLVFSTPSNFGFIGSYHNFMWIGVSTSKCNPLYSTSIPEAAFAFFQSMFATICPLLITGGYAERVGARTSLAFSLIWSLIVYYPVAHWIWGHGGWLQIRGVQDFAGGIVLHTSAGAAALVAAMFVGRRHGFDDHHCGEFPPSNLPLAALGVSGLWTGWFFFNGASALGANSIAVSAALSTQVGAVMCCFCYYMFSTFNNHPQQAGVVATMNGLIAGMAGITPASGYISVPATLGLGAVLGLTYWGQHLIKVKLRIDDALDVSVVHGLTGVIGSLAVGLIASSHENPNSQNGVFYGGPWSFFGWQVVAVLSVAAWSAVWTWIILLAMNWVYPVRVPAHVELEQIGLDIHHHGEFAYHGLRLKGNEPLFDSLLRELGHDDDDEDDENNSNDGNRDVESNSSAENEELRWMSSVNRVSASINEDGTTSGASGASSSSQQPPNATRQQRAMSKNEKREVLLSLARSSQKLASKAVAQSNAIL